MLWWVIGIAIVVIGLIVIFWWRLARRKRAMKVLMRRNQHLCDQVVAQVLHDLRWQYPDPLRSQPVADVWGHGIMAFAYALPTAQPPVSQAAFATALKAVPAIPQTEALARLVITDWWTRDALTHIDIAYVTNAATREYVEDVRRV
ncbi:hypothetical protein ACFQ5J_03395 [Lacticaseibacillus baoqingensis]|uniref:Uncharacterized protein n=1 Tax=Lacticaseibacillus baoqingensis TaxID=2486013 RepID=A0ABW4E753_9LACO|nr:hypothetical protein [Lacticaseibacillus baoqingensis]